MKVLIGIILTIALIVAGVWLDLVVFLVGGVEEIIRGIHAHGSLQSHDIAFGIVHLVCSGAGVAVAAILIAVVWGICFGTSNSRRPVSSRRY
jgi:hypothetical protein